jgi:hypothetical protein
MSSIEERLAKDITAVTGGVVVTESDLRNARDSIDERIESRRQWDRRRAVIEAAAAAVVVLVLGITAFLTLGGDDETAAPANPGPTTSDLHAGFLSGRAPTPDLIHGVWRLDNGGVLMRFAPPNLISLDYEGRLFHNPGVQGTYAIDGDLITVSVDDGPDGCGGDQFAMRASVPNPGALHFVFTQAGTDGCTGADKDERWVMEQVLPTSQTWADAVVSGDSGWQPLSDEHTLYGSWLTEGGGHVLEIDPGGSYYVADESAEPIDQGQWSLRGTDLTLTSSAESTTCTKGDRLVLGPVKYVDSVPSAMRSTVQKNTCGVAWAEAVWILIPHEGTLAQ